MWSRRLDGMIDTHEPPLFKSVLLERGFWPVVVGEVFGVDVPSPHSGGVKSSRQNEYEEFKLGASNGRVPMWALARGIEAATTVKRTFRMSQVERVR